MLYFGVLERHVACLSEKQNMVGEIHNYGVVKWMCILGTNAQYMYIFHMTNHKNPAYSNHYCEPITMTLQSAVVALNFDLGFIASHTM